MWTEPVVSINGTLLTVAQAEAVRIAVCCLYDTLIDPDVVSQDPIQRANEDRIQPQLGAVIEIMFEGVDIDAAL